MFHGEKFCRGRRLPFGEKGRKSESVQRDRFRAGELKLLEAGCQNKSVCSSGIETGVGAVVLGIIVAVGLVVEISLRGVRHGEVPAIVVHEFSKFLGVGEGAESGPGHA